MGEDKDYAMIDRTTHAVVNVIIWNGVNDISFITDYYDLICMTGRSDVAYIGGYYDPVTDTFSIPE